MRLVCGMGQQADSNRVYCSLTLGAEQPRVGYPDRKYTRKVEKVN